MKKGMVKEFKRGAVANEDDEARIDVLFTIEGLPLFQKILSGL
jgi:hypothetical protein